LGWGFLLAGGDARTWAYPTFRSQNHKSDIKVQTGLNAVAPEILPGWNLRLNVHSDGQGYDVLLRDLTDDKCGYAAPTDESGVIRQRKAIDCEI
jgi:hypothetical protein